MRLTDDEVLELQNELMPGSKYNDFINEMIACDRDWETLC